MLKQIQLVEWEGHFAWNTEIEQQLGYAEQSAYGPSHWTSARSGAFMWLVELNHDGQSTIVVVQKYSKNQIISYQHREFVSALFR